MKESPFDLDLFQGETDRASFEVMLQKESGQQGNVIDSLALRPFFDGVAFEHLRAETGFLLMQRILGIARARDAILYLADRYREASFREDEGAMDQWKDLLRKAYHMQLLPALAMLAAPEPNGFFRALFHSSRQDAEGYVNSVRAEAGEYLKGMGFDL